MKESTGKRLRQLMNDRNLKQVDILQLCQPYCEKYGIKLAKNDLSQYINDKVQPGQDKLSILGMALDVSEVWLMGYEVPISTIAPAARTDDLSALEREIICRFRKADEFDQETILRTLRIKRDDFASSQGAAV